MLTRWGIPVGLFLLALAVRLPALGQFLTPDEFLWVDRSRNFLAGLLNTAYVCESPTNHTGLERAVGLACTLRTGHPGVTTMWTGSMGIFLHYLANGAPGPLFDYVLAVQTNPLDPSLIVPTRLPTVVLTSLWVVAAYWLDSCVKLKRALQALETVLKQFKNGPGSNTPLQDPFPLTRDEFQELQGGLYGLPCRDPGHQQRRLFALWLSPRSRQPLPDL